MGGVLSADAHLQCDRGGGVICRGMLSLQNSCPSMLLSSQQDRMSLDGHAYLDCTAVDRGLVGCQVGGQVIALRALRHQKQEHGR